MAGEVDRRLRERLADRERWPDGALHALMDAWEIGGVGAEHCRGEVMPQRRLDALHRLVGPGLYRHRLPPALHSVRVGQAHQHRRAHGRFEELEFADQRVIEPADLDPGDPRHPLLTIWLRDWIVESFEHAPHIADGARRRARAVGDIVERFYRHVASIAVFPERGKQWREFLLALPRALALAIVQ